MDSCDIRIWLDINQMVITVPRIPELCMLNVNNLKPSVDGDVISRDGRVNTIVADALAPFFPHVIDIETD